MKDDECNEPKQTIKYLLNMSSYVQTNYLNDVDLIKLIKKNSIKAFVKNKLADSILDLRNLKQSLLLFKNMLSHL